MARIKHVISDRALDKMNQATEALGDKVQKKVRRKKVEVRLKTWKVKKPSEAINLAWNLYKEGRGELRRLNAK